ncbi:unnamed protein product, partial [Mesorhabditis belari]|uniref:DnaJ homolog subfamily C member 10 n=1 Tax=Mesorhabditis belari TaxID=2138241 RepID=A0AAF3F540_9BILA
MRWQCGALFALLCIGRIIAGDDYYEILGVQKDADDRTIRKAFKKLAIQKHPDKNKDNPEAHAEFLKINRAYEVLKDEEMRKKFDQYGEAGLADDFNPNQNFQSWQFYRDNFGIYDEDTEITTLNRVEFTQMVSGTGEIWFINFYSTYCGHCHQLAPTWRKFAAAMDGVIRVGAVNCAEDPGLCQSQNVFGYPSLVWYPDGTPYQGPRDLELLIDFVMSRLPNQVVELTSNNYLVFAQQTPETANKPWIIDFCDDSDRCLSQINRRKLGSMLFGLVNVGTISCYHGSAKDDLCELFDRTDGVLWFEKGRIEPGTEQVLDSLDPKELSSIALQKLDSLPEMDEDDVKSLFDQHIGAMTDTVVWFVKDQTTVEEKKDMVRLQTYFPKYKIGFFDCSRNTLCAEQLDVAKLPTTVLFKANGGYEINYATSKNSWRDQMVFIREASKTPMKVLTPEMHDDAVESGDLWLVDYFAPWCPPCMRLMSELRQVHSQLDEDSQKLNIGTIDCTRHLAVCQKAGVTSYPHKKLYYKGKTYSSVGYSSAPEIIDFMEDALNPSVAELTPEKFAVEIADKAAEITWVVDFFAPWCGPCQQLAPEFQRAGRLLRDHDSQNVKYGSVDCQAHRAFCDEQRIGGYPTIRLYTAESVQQKRSVGRIIDYPGNMWRNADSISQWTMGYLPSVVTQMGNEFYAEVLDATTPYLVDFYAPWCGPCMRFAPIFDQIAKALEGRVQLAKVDCDQWPGVCQGAGIRAYPSLRLYRGAQNGRRQDLWGIDIQSQVKDHIIQVVQNYIGIIIFVIQNFLLIPMCLFPFSNTQAPKIISKHPNPLMAPKRLQWLLQELKDFEKPKIQLEQYATSAELAVLVCLVECVSSTANGLEGKSVLDLGCGCGMLMVAMAASCSSTYCLGVDIDDDALRICRENLETSELSGRCELIQADVTKLPQLFGKEKFDIVITNPPFGTKNNAGLDMQFLQIGLSLLRPGGHIFSLHKTSTRRFVLKKAKEFNDVQEVECLAEMLWELPATYKFHKKKSVDIQVDVIHCLKK